MLERSVPAHRNNWVSPERSVFYKVPRVILREERAMDRPYWNGCHLLIQLKISRELWKARSTRGGHARTSVDEAVRRYSQSKRLIRAEALQLRFSAANEDLITPIGVAVHNSSRPQWNVACQDRVSKSIVWRNLFCC